MISALIPRPPPPGWDRRAARGWRGWRGPAMAMLAPLRHVRDGPGRRPEYLAQATPHTRLTIQSVITVAISALFRSSIIACPLP